VDQLGGDPDIELVVIATPHDSHAKLFIKALKSGKHVVRGGEDHLLDNQRS